MNYTWSFPYIKDIKIAFEVGSRDLLDANEIAAKYNCKVYSFECNPDCIRECLKNNTDDRVHLIQKAVCEQDGKISFMAFDLNKYDNMGASSIYEIDFTSNRPVYDPDYGRKDVQKKVDVDACRLDTFCNEQTELPSPQAPNPEGVRGMPLTGIKREGIIPDAIFMDVQEAELNVLKSMGELLNKVKYIVFEASNSSTYKGGCCYNDIDLFLKENGFRYRGDNMPESQKNNSNWGFCDWLYINKNVL
jgi:FkbM family methyltransferase